MLPTQKTPPKPNLHDLTVLVHGPHKFGKSTLCAQSDGALFLATEPGLNHLEVYQQPISTWGELLAAAKEIAEGKHTFRTIVIDTVDNAYRMCAEYICRKYEVEHESDLEYGKGYAMVNAEFHRVLNKLALLPYGLFLVSHSQEKEIETRTGKYTKVVPTLPDKARKLVLGLVDIILFCDLEQVTGGDGKPAYRRVLRTKPSMAYEAGDRTGRLPEVLELNFAAFAAAFAQGTPGSAVAAVTAVAAPTASSLRSSAQPRETAGVIDKAPGAIDPAAAAAPAHAVAVTSQVSSEASPTVSAASAVSAASSAAAATPRANARSTGPGRPATADTARPRVDSAAIARSAASSPRLRTAGASTTTTSPAAARPRTTSTASR
jgi:hypothetical protein